MIDGVLEDQVRVDVGAVTEELSEISEVVAAIGRGEVIVLVDDLADIGSKLLCY